LTWAEVKIGLVVVLALAILMVMVMTLEEGVGLFTRPLRLQAQVDHSQGLKIGGPVRMNGVDVGHIHGIHLAAGRASVEIVFTISADAAAHLREDASVAIQPMGMLGDKFLEILPGTSSQPLPPQATLSGKADGDFGVLASNAGRTIEQVNATLQEIQRVLTALSRGEGTAGRLLNDPALYDRSARVMEKLERATDSGLALLEQAQRGQGTLGQLLNDRELYARANAAVKELNELTARLNKASSTVSKLAEPALYARLETLTERSEKLLSRIQEGEGTVGKLVMREELYQRVDRLLTEVETFVADVKQHPAKYFKISLF
jgi:phospholipid/cholesterol/gamma-HCH transport system substrate-binding protein